MEQDFKRRLEHCIDSGDFDGATGLLFGLSEERPLHPSELVSLGRYILLGSGMRWSLPDAESAFKRALEIDSEHVPALIELGWFYQAMMDDPNKGVGYFDKGAEVLESLSEEVKEGWESCRSELDDSED